MRTVTYLTGSLDFVTARMTPAEIARLSRTNVLITRVTR